MGTRQEGEEEVSVFKKFLAMFSMPDSQPPDPSEEFSLYMGC